MTSYAIRASEAGTAVLIFDRDSEGRIDVELIERLPAGLDPAAEWLRATFPKLPEIDDATVIVDADGFGMALWALLKVRGTRGWRLYDRVGRERQELVNALLVAVSDRRIHIAPSVHEVAMRKALTAYKRTVGDDGVIGAELVVALALAAAVRPRHPLYLGVA